jgi:hypothetical protein
MSLGLPIPLPAGFGVTAGSTDQFSANIVIGVSHAISLSYSKVEQNARSASVLISTAHSVSVSGAKSVTRQALITTAHAVTISTSRATTLSANIVINLAHAISVGYARADRIFTQISISTAAAVTFTYTAFTAKASASVLFAQAIGLTVVGNTTNTAAIVIGMRIGFTFKRPEPSRPGKIFQGRMDHIDFDDEFEDYGQFIKGVVLGNLPEVTRVVAAEQSPVLNSYAYTEFDATTGTVEFDNPGTLNTFSMPFWFKLVEGAGTSASIVSWSSPGAGVDIYADSIAADKFSLRARVSTSGGDRTVTITNLDVGEWYGGILSVGNTVAELRTEQTIASTPLNGTFLPSTLGPRLGDLNSRNNFTRYVQDVDIHSFVLTEQQKQDVFSIARNGYYLRTVPVNDVLEIASTAVTDLQADWSIVSV